MYSIVKLFIIFDITGLLWFDYLITFIDILISTINDSNNQRNHYYEQYQNEYDLSLLDLDCIVMSLVHIIMINTIILIKYSSDFWFLYEIVIQTLDHLDE